MTVISTMITHWHKTEDPLAIHHWPLFEHHCLKETSRLKMTYSDIKHLSVLFRWEGNSGDLSYNCYLLRPSVWYANPMQTEWICSSPRMTAVLLDHIYSLLDKNILLDTGESKYTFILVEMSRCQYRKIQEP